MIVNRKAHYGAFSVLFRTDSSCLQVRDLKVGVGDMEQCFFEISRFTILSRFFVMLVLLCCKLSERYSQTNFSIIKAFQGNKKRREKKEWQVFIIIIIICYICIALFWVLKALYIVSGMSPHLPPMCSIHLDDVTAAILCQNAHHTPAYWWRGDRVMKPISVWGWFGGHDGQRPI